MGAGKKREWNGNFVVSLLAFFFFHTFLNTENKVSPTYLLLDFNAYLLMAHFVLFILPPPTPFPGLFSSKFQTYNITNKYLVLTFKV